MSEALVWKIIAASAEGFLVAVFAGAVVVWLFNNVLTQLRESPLKKVAPPALLPLAALAGAGHGWAAFHDWPRLGLPAWAGLGILLWCGFDAWREAARNRAAACWELRTAIPAVRTDYMARQFPQPLLSALPLNRQGRLRWNRTELPVLSPQDPGKEVCIVFLADFHLHPFLNTAFFREAIRLALGSEPDIVLLGGDFATKRAQAGEAAELLRSFRWPENTFAVRGNHEFWTRPAFFRRALAEAGIRLLSNEHHRVRTAGGREVLIAGLEDPYIPLTARKEARLREAIAAEDAEGGRLPRIGFVHTPESYARAAAIGCDLVLGGHTHGGQVRLPVFGTTISSCPVPRRFVYGRASVNGTMTLTTNGLGAYYGIRWRCPPEISEVVLTPRL